MNESLDLHLSLLAHDCERERKNISTIGTVGAKDFGDQAIARQYGHGYQANKHPLLKEGKL